MMPYKPFSQACVNNRDAILAVLRRAFAHSRRVLEIGSGTGQHAVFFAPALSHLCWQPSDCEENLAGIEAWITAEPAVNLLAPIHLDVNRNWPSLEVDAIFTANTCHIMPWPSVVNMFAGIGAIVGPKATLAIYGPFKYDGQFTTPSNARFDLWLKEQAPHQGVRNIEDIISLASEVGFELVEDNSMPANNQLLVFKNNQ